MNKNDEFYFENLLFISGNIRATISFDRLSERFRRAQWYLGEQVLQSCRARMPHATGNLQQRSHTEDGGRTVVFPGPAARMLYGGVVMVDSETGRGPRKIHTKDGGYVFRYRRGATLIPGSKLLTYSRAEATDHWFDHAKAEDGEKWIAGAKKVMGGWNG